MALNEMLTGGNFSAVSDTARIEHNRALHGVRIVDLTHFESGPSCTEMLAWLGAEVIKVEEPTKGEQGRSATRDLPGADSYYFILLNANKRSVTANLKHEKGRAILRSLIEKSDVLIENFAPGAIERLGFGWDAVKEINPRIIYAQIKGFAPDGPFANNLSFDMIAQAMGGSLSLTGEEGGRPLRPGVTIGDTGAGLHCTIGILAALYQRQFTGRGQRVEVAMQEAVINFARISFASQALWGKAAYRNGNQSILFANAPCEAYQCEGGGPNDYCYVYTSRASSKQWECLLKVIGREDLIDDPRFATAELRYQSRDEIDRLVSEWTRRHDKFSVMKMLAEAGVPAGAVMDTMELSQDQHLRKRGMFVTINHPVRGPVTMPGCPVKMSESYVPVEPPPLLGEHTNEIYCELLGFTPEEVAALRKENAI